MQRAIPVDCDAVSVRIVSSWVLGVKRLAVFDRAVSGRRETGWEAVRAVRYGRRQIEEGNPTGEPAKEDMWTIGPRGLQSAGSVRLQ